MRLKNINFLFSFSFNCYILATSQEFFWKFPQLFEKKCILGKDRQKKPWIFLNQISIFKQNFCQYLRCVLPPKTYKIKNKIKVWKLFFRETKNLLKNTCNIYDFPEGIKPTRKFLQKIHIFEYLRTFSDWTVAKIEWRLVCVN